MVTTLGKVTSIESAGLHFKLPYPIQDVTKVAVNKTQKLQIGYSSGNEDEGYKDSSLPDEEVGILLSKAKATAEELKGQGESEYMKIIAAAYSTEDRVQYYEFIRSLEALKETMKGDKTIILPADSFIVKVLNGN